MSLINKLFHKEELFSNEDITSICDGEIIPLEEVEDDVFKNEIMGQTLAFNPSSGDICSPVNGTIEFIFPTKHAFGVAMEDGTKILVHIGIDTVSLNGKGFVSFKKQGDKVEVGAKVIHADLNAIKEAGYKTTSMLIITEKESDRKVTFISPQKVTKKQIVIV